MLLAYKCNGNAREFNEPYGEAKSYTNYKHKPILTLLYLIKCAYWNSKDKCQRCKFGLFTVSYLTRFYPPHVFNFNRENFRIEDSSLHSSKDISTSQ